MREADNGNSEWTATAEQLGDDTLDNVTGGRDAPGAIGICREPTRHPAKVSVPS
jgi:hypothetical protein